MTKLRISTLISKSKGHRILVVALALLLAAGPFVGAAKVFADSTPNAIAVSVKQNDVALEQDTDGAFLSTAYTGTDSIEATFTVDGGLDPSHSYRLNFCGRQSDISDINNIKFNCEKLSNYYSETVFPVTIKDVTARTTAAEGSFTVRQTADNFTAFSGFNITEVKQGNEVITPTEKDGIYTFTLNNIENIFVTYEVSSAMDDYTYPLYLANAEDSGNKTGAELKGTHTVKIINPVAYSSSNTAFGVFDGASYVNKVVNDYYSYNGGNNNIVFAYANDEVSRSFAADLAYANSEDKIINGHVSPDLHNINNPIALNISGRNYDENTTYNVKVSINKNTSSATYINTYNHTFQVSGKDLNAGTRLAITGFVMDFMSDNQLVTNGNVYDITVRIADEARNNEYVRTYGADYVYGDLRSIIKHSDGTINASDVQGDDICSGHYCLNRTSINETAVNGSSIYYLASGFNDNSTYRYEFYNGAGTASEDFYNAPTNNQSTYALVTSGTVSGKDLNNGKFNLPLNSSRNVYGYILLIKNSNGKVINFINNVLNTWNTNNGNAGIISTKLTTLDHESFLQMNRYEYAVSREDDLTITLYGAGFDSNASYNVNTVIWDNFVKDSYQKATFTGAELNNGTATITIAKPDAKVSNITVNIGVNQDGSSKYYSGAHLGVDYVDMTDYIYSGVYRINAENGIVSGVTVGTTAREFINNFHFISDEASAIKVYAKDGETEVTGVVATGMIARVISTNGDILGTLSIAVAGDNNGDGVITATDLARTRLHLAETRLLTGVNLVAADVNLDGSVTATDLAKIRQIIAN